MNYIILNGLKSTMIKGLLIQTLPPISKPLKRTLIEEIDGRDGDIVTELGYSAYDKEITIGLHGEYDVDEVIAFFDSKGTVTFSNEPDKYYNYEIIEQIDLERLIRFKTATVTFHMQPFKYSLERSMVADNFKNLFDALALAYGTTETDTPASNYINMLTGVGSFDATFMADYEDDIIVAYLEVTGLESGEDYTLSGSGSLTDVEIYSDELWGTVIESGDIGDGLTFTATGTSALIAFVSTGETEGTQVSCEEIQLEKGSTKTDYDPFGTVIVNNFGNTKSKPKLTLFGNGTINLYLNGVQIFVINLDDHIVLDCAEMNAYKDGELANRSVAGDYDNFALLIGRNTISWSGNVTEINIENYSRWI